MDALPNETLLKCFRYLHKTRYVDSVRGSCRRFRDIVNVNSASLYHCNGTMVVTVPIQSSGVCIAVCTSGDHGVVMRFYDYTCCEADYKSRHMINYYKQQTISSYLPCQSFQECVQFCTRTIPRLSMVISHLPKVSLPYLEQFFRVANTLTLTTTDLSKDELHRIFKDTQALILKENLGPEVLDDNFFRDAAIEKLELRFSQNLTMEKLHIIMSRPQLKVFSFIPTELPTAEFIKTLCQELLQIEGTTKQVLIAFDYKIDINSMLELMDLILEMSLQLSTGEILHGNRVCGYVEVNFLTPRRHLNLKLCSYSQVYTNGIKMRTSPSITG